MCSASVSNAPKSLSTSQSQALLFLSPTCLSLNKNPQPFDFWLIVQPESTLVEKLENCRLSFEFELWMCCFCLRARGIRHLSDHKNLRWGFVLENLTCLFSSHENVGKKAKHVDLVLLLFNLYDLLLLDYLLWGLYLQLGNKKYPLESLWRAVQILLCFTLYIGLYIYFVEASVLSFSIIN